MTQPTTSWLVTVSSEPPWDIPMSWGLGNLTLGGVHQLQVHVVEHVAFHPR